MSNKPGSSTSGNPPVVEPVTSRLKRTLLGAPRDLGDRSIYHAMALAPFLAWVGLGADALSSTSYGPEEGFKVLGEHTFIAIALALATALTVAMISGAYSRLIENFPNGGGYGVASRLLGRHAGLLSGCALLVDYGLTITISIASAGDAIFSFLPDSWHPAKLASEGAMIVALTMLNLRGVRESVVVLMPMFVLFLLTHAVLIGAGIIFHLPQVAETTAHMRTDYHHGLAALGFIGLLKLFLHAYSLGGGTYTGIEAVSNALPLMREPRVANAKRTMLYLAISLAITAAGLLVCFLLWKVQADEHKTLNAVLFESITGKLPGGHILVIVALISEAMLLIVAAQAGFMGGPRVGANMAVDSWLPHAFSSLSERLTIENGILILSGASLGALLYTHGDVSTIVVMYSINVFLTFSLTMAGMTRFWFRQRKDPRRAKRLALFISCFLLCATILVVTVSEKFLQGGWITLAATFTLLLFCLYVRHHYRQVSTQATKLYAQFGELPMSDDPPFPVNTTQPTAVILVGAYGPLGIHTLLNALRVFPGHFVNAVFVSVGVMDSGVFKGEDTADELRDRTEEALRKYVRLATGLGLPAAYRWSVGTDPVDEAEDLCLKVAKEFPRAVFFAGKLIFRNERWYHRMLHNNTAHAVQKRLHWAGRAMVIMPARMG